MIVTAHQPNYLPGLGVIEKIEAADAVIWLDQVQYERGGWTNRNRMRDGSWLSVPVYRRTEGGPIDEVVISPYDRHWRRKHTRTIRQHYDGPVVDEVCRVIAAPCEHLIELNFACLSVLLPEQPVWLYQSNHDDREGPISGRLARMVARAGGTEYLSGPSGRAYLDEEPFRRLGVAVTYAEPREANPCVLSRYAAGVPA